ncbi:M57 family metalloprotease [Aquimarina sp. 2201CG5-10]|uniref:M57 family metalloprotease n=1 Tax=Aquimarina callyspongiae TaxID=3098150 RepID=UPI002AB38AC5|nr:M57 family metalloprotease [Aquimarina sp. 2201CG5-10]MDY8135598.1 M57 family metalloprotease [Aquimarina sp. 2201CG5-10]
MKTIKLLTLSVLIAALFSSCQNEGLNEETANLEKTPTKDQLTKLASLGVNTDNVIIKTITNLDDTKEDYFLNDTDLSIPVSELSDMESLETLTDGTKHYRTRNLISSRNRTIDILGYTGGGGFGLSNTNRQALQRAVNNYNRLNSSLNLRLSFGTNYQAADMVVYVRSDLGSGGLAGFPSGGRPYKWVRIGPRVDDLGVGYSTHVIAHEMGHCIGLRHTDWFARVCDNGANEGQSSEGAIHIPGTPTGIDYSSIMISCPVPGTNPRNYTGRLVGNDRTAIEYLY